MVYTIYLYNSVDKTYFRIQVALKTFVLSMCSTYLVSNNKKKYLIKQQ